MQFERCGDRALLMRLADTPQPAVSRRISALRQSLLAAEPAGLEDAIPGFVTLLIMYDPDVTTADALARIAHALMPAEDAPGRERIWTLPVCYDESMGLDIASVAARIGLACEDVVRLHTSRPYTVYLLGFSPGFPYLGDLDDRLVVPRRHDPRPRVPAGSVAIATRYTAIYPQETAGGWHLLGRTPVRLFDAASDAPALLQPGDSVRFHAVPLEEYESLRARVAAGGFVPECEVRAA
jgi:KipI family sensor histidine kinase inhibitor